MGTTHAGKSEAAKYDELLGTGLGGGYSFPSYARLATVLRDNQFATDLSGAGKAIHQVHRCPHGLFVLL